MIRMSKSVLAIIISLLFSQCATTNPRIGWLDGSWSGTGYEPEIDEFYPIELEVNSELWSFNINYPTFPCSGKWNLWRSKDGKIVFFEKLTENIDNCQDGAEVIVTEVKKNFISVSYFLPEYKDEVIVISVLEREK